MEFDRLKLNVDVINLLKKMMGRDDITHEYDGYICIPITPQHCVWYGTANPTWGGSAYFLDNEDCWWPLDSDKENLPCYIECYVDTDCPDAEFIAKAIFHFHNQIPLVKQNAVKAGGENA